MVLKINWIFLIIDGTELVFGTTVENNKNSNYKNEKKNILKIDAVCEFLITWDQNEVRTLKKSKHSPIGICFDFLPCDFERNHKKSFLIRIFSFCFLLCLDQLQLVGNLQRLIGQLSNFSKLLVGFIRPLVHCKKMRGLITEFLATNWHSKYFVTQAIAYVYRDFSLSFDYKINLLVITLGNSQEK